MKKIIKVSALVITIGIVALFSATFLYQLLKWKNSYWAYDRTLSILFDPFSIREKARIEKIKSDRIQQCSDYIEQAKHDDVMFGYLLANFQNKPKAFVRLVKDYNPSKPSDLYNCPNVPKHWQEFGDILENTNIDTRADSLSLFAFYHSQGNTQATINPLHNPEKALYYLMLSAQEGIAVAQLLLAHLYETGEVLNLKTTADPIKGIAWRVAALSGDPNYATRNNQKYNQDDYINERCEIFKIDDCNVVHTLSKQFIKDYPLTTFVNADPIDFSKKQYIKEFSPEHLEKSKKLRDDTAKIIKEGAYKGYAHEMVAFGNSLVDQEFLYDLNVGTLYIHDYIDYEEAEKWYLKAYEFQSPAAAYALGELYATTGNKQYGFNPLYNEKQSLEYFEIAGNLGNKHSLNILYDYAYSHKNSFTRLHHFDEDENDARKIINTFKNTMDVESQTIVNFSGMPITINEFLKDDSFFKSDDIRQQAQKLLEKHTQHYDFVRNSAWKIIDSLNYIDINNSDIVQKKLIDYVYRIENRMDFQRKLTEKEIIQATKIIDEYLTNLHKSNLQNN